jgi:type I restriction enzyme, S subunit
MSSGAKTMFHFEVEPQDLNDQLVVQKYKSKNLLKKLKQKFDFSKIGHLCDIASGMYFQEYSPEGMGKKYLRVDNIREFVCDLNKEDLVYVSNGAKEISKRIIAEEGDLLLARTGTLGKVALVFGPIIGSILSQHVSRLSLKKEEIDPGFLASFLNSDLGKTQILSNAFGSTRPELTKDALSEIEVPDIDIGTQIIIGREAKRGIEYYYSHLETINQAICEYEKALQVIPFEDNLTRTFKVDHLGENWVPRYYIPNHKVFVENIKNQFKCEKLSKIATIERGKGTRVSEYSDKGIPFIRTTSLINYSIDPFPDHYATSETYYEFSQLIARGDLLLSMEGKIGNIALLSNHDSCVFKNHIVHIRARDPMHSIPLFLFFASKVGQIELKRNTIIQSTIPGLSNRLNDILIPMTPKNPRTDFDLYLNRAIRFTEKAMNFHDLASIHFKNAKCQIEDLIR